ncbi:MAG: S-layer homology domain-containing protein [Caryophanon sp.]|nr:S-layer homology domain-containing protein [Caryophanon sp.]
MKKFLSMMAFAALLLALPTDTKAEQFPDVNHKTELGRAIDFLSEEDVISGFPDGTFRPNDPVTRGQASKMMAQLTNATSVTRYNPNTKPTFKDIGLTHQYYADINALYEYGVIGGYEDGTFKHGRQITRAHTAKMIANLFVLPHFEVRQRFVDVPRTSDRYQSVNSVFQARIMRETTKERFSPDKTITRGEFALFLFRAYNYTATTIKAAEKLKPFISETSEIGKAFSEHDFMDADIRQRMQISAARQSFDQPHFSSPATIKDNCSQFMEQGFKLCYGQGFLDGQIGITSVYLYGDAADNYKVSALQNQLSNTAFTYENAQLGNVQWHYGKTTKAIDGLYYQFTATAGESAPYATVANSDIVQLQISTRPIYNIK